MTTQSVDRAIAILKQFNVEEPELGVTELSRRVGLTKGTVHRLLASLREGGLVDQDPESRKYRLGRDLLQLCYTVLYGDHLLRVVLPYLHYLAGRVGELAYLGVQDGDHRLIAAQAENPALKESVGWYPRAPLAATSSGKVFLAHMTEDELGAYINKGLPELTPKTVSDPADLRAQLKHVREEGFATSFEEYREGTNAVGVPIKHHDRVIATLAVVGRSHSFTRADALDSVEILKGVALEISQKLQQSS